MTAPQSDAERAWESYWATPGWPTPALSNAFREVFCDGYAAGARDQAGRGGEALPLDHHDASVLLGALNTLACEVPLSSAEKKIRGDLIRFNAALAPKEPEA